tara:strand:- start:5352 stop:5762 length:411 start_codon:yes stop_codon:yes gene_type:complete
MIDRYLREFREDPYGIQEFKIVILKNYYFDNMNSVLNCERDNFQIGVNKNENLLFFRDKSNKNNELVLNIIENRSFFKIRKNISYSVSSLKINGINSENRNETNKLLSNSLKRINTDRNSNSNDSKKCCKLNCSIN